MKVHLMGIGGTGVSSQALVLAARGHRVSGCDTRLSAATEQLVAGGIAVVQGHDPAHVEGIDLLVHSGAIRADSAEPAAARDAGIRVLSRAVMLAELISAGEAVAVAGTHGKTTTTHMLGQVLTAAGFDPSVLVGDGQNTRAGRSNWLVAEADESDGSLVLHHPAYAIVTNVELDHPDHFRDLAAVREVFQRFVSQVRELTVVCADDAEAMRLEVPGRRVTYGLKDGDYSASQLGLALTVPGRHNLLNATGVAALALELGVSPNVVRKTLAGFTGAHRRMEFIGSWRGVPLYDDYGHHPTEIRATLQAARELAPKRVILVFQPHRYTRLGALLEEFAAAIAEADLAIVTEVYAAGEKPGGVSAVQLAEKVPGARFAPHFDTVKDDLYGLIQPGDLVLFMGAGDIWKIPDELVK